MKDKLERRETNSNIRCVWFSNFIHKIIDWIRNNLFHLALLSFFISYHILGILILILIFISREKIREEYNHNKNSIKYFIKNGLIMYFVFELETSTNYLVSYFDKNKYDYTPEEDYLFNFLDFIFPWWKEAISFIEEFITIPNTGNYAILSILILLIELMNRYKTKRVSGLIWGGFYMKVISVTRIIRILAFTSTVIPNPKLNCYQEKFVIPETNLQMIFDMLKFRTGGCNDLIISGHTLYIWVTNKYLNEIFVGWSTKIVNFVSVLILINIVIQRNHYSVDVILAIVISELVWEYLKVRNEDIFEMFEKEENEININVPEISSSMPNITSNSIFMPIEMNNFDYVDTTSDNNNVIRVNEMV